MDHRIHGLFQGDAESTVFGTDGGEKGDADVETELDGEADGDNENHRRDG